MVDATSPQHLGYSHPSIAPPDMIALADMTGC
jgi:hypothetical protein